MATDATGTACVCRVLQVQGMRLMREARLSRLATIYVFRRDRVRDAADLSTPAQEADASSGGSLAPVMKATASDIV